jgi:hypothetical protein
VLHFSELSRKSMLTLWDSGGNQPLSPGSILPALYWHEAVADANHSLYFEAIGFELMAQAIDVYMKAFDEVI